MIPQSKRSRYDQGEPPADFSRVLSRILWNGTDLKRELAMRLVKLSGESLDVPRYVRIHFTSYPNSSSKVQGADIGLMETADRKDGKDVEGLWVFVRRTMREDAHFSEEIGKPASQYHRDQPARL